MFRLRKTHDGIEERWKIHIHNLLVEAQKQFWEQDELSLFSSLFRLNLTKAELLKFMWMRTEGTEQTCFAIAVT